MSISSARDSSAPVFFQILTQTISFLAHQTLRRLKHQFDQLRLEQVQLLPASPRNEVLHNDSSDTSRAVQRLFLPFFSLSHSRVLDFRHCKP